MAQACLRFRCEERWQGLLTRFPADPDVKVFVIFLSLNTELIGAGSAMNSRPQICHYHPVPTFDKGISKATLPSAVQFRELCPPSDRGVCGSRCHIGQGREKPPRSASDRTACDERCASAPATPGGDLCGVHGRWLAVHRPGLVETH